jgi:hypothetical protein
MMSVVFVAEAVLPMVLVIVLATFLMSVAYVAEVELLMVLVIVLETFLMRAEFGMALEQFTIVDVQIYLKAIVTATVTN